MKPDGQKEDDDFVRRALIVVGLAAIAFIVWQLRYVLVLLFGAVVIATIFRAVASPFTKYLRLPEVAAVLLAAILVIGLFVGAGWLFGSQISAQADLLADSIPSALDRLDQWLGGVHLADQLRTWASNFGQGDIVSRVSTFLSSLSGALGNFLIVLFGGLFLATEPQFYRTGAIKLIPPRRRELIAEAMDESEQALRMWLKGQLMAMIVVGIMTGIGLWLIGLPSALVLALLAGFFEFIPFAGPILAAIPGVLLALAQSPELAFWAIVVYVFVQHSEAYLIQPIIQQYAVEVPAVVLLFSLLGFGLLFGVIGVVFAAPLTVVSYVLVKRLYVIEALDTPTPIPGESSTKDHTSSKA